MRAFPVQACYCFVAFCCSLVGSTSAELITQTVNHQLTATPDGPNQTFDLDVDQDGTTDFTLRSIIGIAEDPTFASFADVLPPFSTINGLVIDAVTGDGFPTVSRLQLGDTVSAASLFSGNNDDNNLSSQIFPDAPTGNFQNQSGYVGFQFAGAGGTYFGFAHITVNDLTAAQDPLAIFISTVSYESVAGQGAIVAAVPEPSTIALLCSGLGLLGFSLRTRRCGG